jgi:general secretion pathway protein A
MYDGFYGLGGRPFDLTPDPRFLLLTPKHREALSHVEYLLAGRTSLALLLGEAGTGKTTLLRAARESSGRESDCVVTLDNPTLTRDEFFEFLAEGFHLGGDAGRSKTRVLRELARSLDERRQRGGVSALVVDEAQSLSGELLEEIRLLANLETRQAMLLSILLAGQPELAHRLNDPDLRQLKQRIALRGTLEPLTLPETADYIAGRLRIVGGDAARTFTRDAVEAVFVHAGGIPRTVSVICENALILGFATGARPIDRDVVLEVCHDLDLGPAPGRVPAAPAYAPVPEAPHPPPAYGPVPEAPHPQPASGPVPEAPHPQPAAVSSAPAALGPPPAPSPESDERAPSPRRAAAGEHQAEPGRWRRALGLLRFRRRGAPASLRLQMQRFDAPGERGFVLTPVAVELSEGKAE